MLPLVITVEQADGGIRRYAFAESPVTIGRSPFAALQLTEPFISRWEGALRFDESEISYFHLGTTNSTYVNGRTLTDQEQDVLLGMDSALMLGELTLRFSREPVPEGDLRRRGCRHPTRTNSATGLKTMYLEAMDAWAAPSAFVPAAAAPPSSEAESAHRLSPSSEADRWSPALNRLLEAQRTALGSVVAEVRAQLAVMPANAHAPWLRELIRREPTLATNAELRADLTRIGIATPGELPELQSWLQAVTGDLLPDAVQFDSQGTLTRVLGLLEALIQSLAEINDAQESVRRRWLGRGSRRSLLQSDNGNLVLAYLLNPQADWESRLHELEQSVRDVISHELALFRATVAGARDLAQALSPDAVVQALARDPALSTRKGDGLWSRWLAQPLREAALWRRFVDLHAGLVDEARYERLFMGRSFARSYLAAMGRPRAPAAKAATERQGR